MRHWGTYPLQFASVNRFGKLYLGYTLWTKNKQSQRMFSKFLPRDAMHKRGLCRHAVSVCVCVCVLVGLSVCLSHSWVVSKRIDIFEIVSISGSHTTLLFPHQTDGDIPTEPRWGRRKKRFWTNIWLRCIRVYSVVNHTSREQWKTKPRRTAASVEHTAAPVVRTRGRRSVCDKLDIRCRRRREVNLPDTTPLVITPFSAAVGHRPCGYFCWKLTLTRTPNPIRPTRPGPDHNRPTNGNKQGGYDLSGGVGHRRRQ